jgi:ankyrin repeat protein
LLLGANVNAANQDGDTALILAAANGRTNIVSVLIAAGADVKAANQDGNTALTLATREGHDETAFRLLDAMPPQETPPSNRRSASINLVSLELKTAYHRSFI